jgi:hypothetical protein
MSNLNFWIVTKATSVSTLNDIAFLTDAEGLIRQARGGLDEKDIVLVTLDAKEANEAAKDQLAKAQNPEVDMSNEKTPNDYSNWMKELQFEYENDPYAPRPEGWDFAQTGGGCTAYTRNTMDVITKGEGYWLMTAKDDATTPRADTPVMVGHINWDGYDDISASEFETVEIAVAWVLDYEKQWGAK